MQRISIYSDQSQVMDMLLKYLESRKYKNVNVNLKSEEITAERKRSFFKTNKFHFKIVNVNPTVTNIEIKVIPQNENPTSDEMKKEIAIAEKIYSFF